jgi:hypothetical protein
MRSHRFNWRTIMVGVASLSLILTIIVQAIRLRSAAVELLRARAKLARVDPEAAWALPAVNAHRVNHSWRGQAGAGRWRAVERVMRRRDFTGLSEVRSVQQRGLSP